MSRRICGLVAVCVLFSSSDASAWLYVIPKASLSDPLAGMSGNWFSSPDSQGQVPIVGYMINSSGHYYFAGDTGDLNTFLERTARAAESEHVISWNDRVSCHVVVHPGAGNARIPGTQPDEAAERAQWKLELLRSSDLAEDGVGIVRSLTINVHVWIDDSIRLDDLDVPPRFEVSSGGEIERFVQEHSM